MSGHGAKVSECHQSPLAEPRRMLSRTHTRACTLRRGSVIRRCATGVQIDCDVSDLYGSRVDAGFCSGQHARQRDAHRVTLTATSAGHQRRQEEPPAGRVAPSAQAPLASPPSSHLRPERQRHDQLDRQRHSQLDQQRHRDERQAPPAPALARAPPVDAPLSERSAPTLEHRRVFCMFCLMH